METHRNLSDEAFAQQFEQCSLPPALFNHEAHLRLAWIQISRHGIDQAIENICTQIKAYVKKLGAEDKFNTTLTIACTRAVYHFMLKSKSANFFDFIEEFPRLKFQLKELLGAHYQIDIFNSPQAKQVYLEPDLLPFD